MTVQEFMEVINKNFNNEESKERLLINFLKSKYVAKDKPISQREITRDHVLMCIKKCGERITKRDLMRKISARESDVNPILLMLEHENKIHLDAIKAKGGNTTVVITRI
jgi:hypothetical protein